MKSILLVSILVLFCSCEFTGVNRSLSNNPGLPDLPIVDEPTDETGNETPVKNIEDEYPFLKEGSFWNRVKEITPIPSSKRCRNVNSYAYFGIVRLVAQYLEGSQFSMFPFASDLRYYRFLDKQEPAEPKKWEIFGQDQLYGKLLEINHVISGLIGRDMTLTGITKHNDFDHDLHCRHRGGNVFDMRPFPGTQPVTWRSKEYDREANLLFIKKLLAWEKVELIFFNDPEILRDKEVKEIIEQRKLNGKPVIFQSSSGHDNHLHIEFFIEGELDRVSQYVYEKKGFNKIQSFHHLEYLYH